MLSYWASALVATLPPNEQGQPQNYSHATLCANRSSMCVVLLDVPPACTSGACPILFCLHGFGGSNLRYPDLCGLQTQKSGWIGVYPQGDPLAIRPDGSLVAGWNDGQAVEPQHTLLRCEYDDFDCSLDPNDGVFIAKIISKLRSAGASGRVYVFGQSNGADLAQRLAVNADQLALPIAGIAPQSSQLNNAPPRSAAGPYNLMQPRTGGPRVAQLSIHGTADGEIAYDGGPKFGSDIFTLFPEPASDAAWAQHNGCNGALTSVNVSLDYFPAVVEADDEVRIVGEVPRYPPPPPTVKGVATHWKWGGCPAEAPVEYYQSHGAGHVSTAGLCGQLLLAVVLEFFGRVERTLAAS
jgi:poly(3-hydroxybutyrate) depolymerase